MSPRALPEGCADGRPEMSPLSPEACAGLLGVSRETSAVLAAYLDLLRERNAVMNLVGDSTLADPWRRHILDCAQLAPLIAARMMAGPDGEGPIVDLGSGAGLPGLVLAILGLPDIHLVESEKRKAAFIAEAAARLGLRVSVHAERAEELKKLKARFLVARAVAPLSRLLGFASPLLRKDATALFLKGRRAEEELTSARKNWTMRASLQTSLSDPEGKVLILNDIVLKGRSRHNG